MLGAWAVEVRAGLAAEVQNVLEALVRDERRAGAAALEEGVGGDRRAVREPLDVIGTDRGRGCDDRLLLLRGCRHLRDADLVVVDQNGIRERAADVDSQRAHACIRTRRPG